MSLFWIALHQLHLAAFEAIAASNKVITREEWEKKLNDVKIRKQDMNKLVMDYLVSEGYIEALEKFRIESGTEPDMDLATIIDRAAVTNAVRSGNLEGVIENVNALDPEILEFNRLLLFRLQQQRLIELIRNGKVEEALEFAQKELAPKNEDDELFLEEAEMTVALLAFEDFSNCPFGELLDISWRLKTATKLNEEILTSQDHEKAPRLAVLLKLLILVQDKLGYKAAYPRINDLSKAILEDPAV